MSAPVYGVMADLHCHAWQQFAETDPATGVNTRLAHILHEVDRCCEEVLQRGGGIVVIAGDLFHSRGNVAPSVFNPVRDRLQRWTARGVRFRLVPGNHDLESRESRELTSAVRMLEGYGVRTYHRPTREDWALFVPWQASEADTLRILDAEADPESAVAFIHAGLNGTISGMPPKALDPAAVAALGFKGVYAGHYHNHRAFPGYVWSIGAPVQHTWGDIGARAGWMILDHSGEDSKEIFFASHAPKFVEIGADLTEEEIPLVVDGHYVKAVLGSATPAEIEAARVTLREMGARGVLIQASPRAPGVRVSGFKASLESLDRAVADWAGANGMPPTVVTRCHEILAEVRG